MIGNTRPPIGRPGLARDSKLFDHSQSPFESGRTADQFLIADETDHENHDSDDATLVVILNLFPSAWPAALVVACILPPKERPQAVSPRDACNVNQTQKPRA